MMRKHAAVYSLAGVKPDAIQMGMLSSDENHQAARVANKLELTANEQAELARKYGVDHINALKEAGVIVNKTVETGAKYGTEGNNLTGLTNEILSGFGMNGQLNMDPTEGLETQKTNAQVIRDNAAANSSNSTAWRNYNKPFYNPSSGGNPESGLSKYEQALLTRAQSIQNSFRSKWADPVMGGLRQGHESDPNYAAYQEAAGIVDTLIQKASTGLRQEAADAGVAADGETFKTALYDEINSAIKAGKTRLEIEQAVYSKSAELRSNGLNPEEVLQNLNWPQQSAPGAWDNVINTWKGLQPLDLIQNGLNRISR
jgi:hypothetical protein